MQTKTKQFSRIGIIFVSCTALLLSGCSLYSSNPYRYIDNYIEDIDLSTVGKIVKSSKSGDTISVGPSSASYLLEGDNTFNLIVERTQNLKGAKCRVRTSYEHSANMSCQLGQLVIALNQSTEDAQITFHVSDYYNGTSGNLPYGGGS